MSLYGEEIKGKINNRTAGLWQHNMLYFVSSAGFCTRFERGYRITSKIKKQAGY